MTRPAQTGELRSPQPDFLPRAPSLPPGIGAHTVLDILKSAAPSLFAQVCDCVRANYIMSMEAQFRRAETKGNTP